MRFLFSILVFLILTVDVSSQCINPAQIDLNVVCPMNYDPVCGCNGVTYSNSCEAYYLGGVSSSIPGICGGGNACINTAQIDSTLLCPTVLEPVCGCDSITYSNSCIAENYAGVTSWTQGPCQNQIQLADSCTNLTGINFGLCDQFLGYGLVNGICSPISGCGTIVGNIDYAPALSSSIESCQTGCLNLSDAPACSNLANVDFGVCAMPLGFGIIGNECQMISGCSTISGTIDYSNSLYSTSDSCQLCLSGGIELIKNFVKVYPTVMDTYLVVEMEKKLQNCSYQIINSVGKTILFGSINTTLNEISVDRLLPGMYILTINNQANLNYRLVKQ
jgi:hypothetical protein